MISVIMIMISRKKNKESLWSDVPAVRLNVMCVPKSWFESRTVALKRAYRTWISIRLSIVSALGTKKKN